MIVRNYIGINGNPILEYVPEDEADRQEIHAMMLDGKIPCPPDTTNWNRLCAALNGFQVLFARWPTRVRVNPISLEDIQNHIFTPDTYAKLNAKVALIADEGMLEMCAEDDSGNSYHFGRDEEPHKQASPTAAEWLDVEPRESIYPPRNDKPKA